MKTEKMKLLVKRLPTDGLYELFEVLIDEINSRKGNSRNARNVSNAIDKFCESTLPKELRSGTNTQNDNKSL